MPLALRRQIAFDLKFQLPGLKTTARFGVEAVRDALTKTHYAPTILGSSSRRSIDLFFPSLAVSSNSIYRFTSPRRKRRFRRKPSLLQSAILAAKFESSSVMNLSGAR